MSKLERILFYAFIFLIPFQARMVLSWGYNEWNSIFLYLTDFLLIGFLFLWIKRLICEKSDFFKFTKWGKSNFLLIVFLLIAVVSLFVASNTEIGIYRFIKLLEFALVFLYIRTNYVGGPTSHIRSGLFRVLIASGVFQAILAIFQFLNQQSLGLRFVEAGFLNPNNPGVANFLFNGERIMRVYGSFPHPNVLAGFLLLCVFAIYAIWLKKEKISWLLIISYGLLIFALFLTFSRVALTVFLVLSLIFFVIQFFKLRPLPHSKKRMFESKKLIKLFGLFLISCILCIIILSPYLKARFFTISMEEQALDLRFFYNKMAVTMIKDKPLLGIGIGNFVWHSQNYQAFLRAADKIAESVSGSEDGLPDWIYQPVHNIYLLIAAEIGLLGLVMFLLFIGSRLIGKIRSIRPIKTIAQMSPMAFVFIGFLIIGLTDHYFWTLQSGTLMFWLVLGLSKLDS